MSDQIQVSVELDKLGAENSLRDLGRQLNAADQLIQQMRRSGIEWASDFKEAVQKARDEVSKLGTITSKATNDMIKGNKNFITSLDNVAKKVSQVQTGLANMGKNFIIPQNASKLAATAGLRDDNESRRQDYFKKQQQLYQKEQAALTQHSSQMEQIRQRTIAREQAQLQARQAAREAFNQLERQAFQRQEQAINAFWSKLNTATQVKDQADKLKSIKQLYIDLQRTSAAGLSSTASLGGGKAVNAMLREQAALARAAAIEAKKKSAVDNDLRNNQEKLAAAGKRLSVVNLSQAGTVNKLGTAWKLAKQELRETISVANLAQSAMRMFTGVFANLGVTIVQALKATPNLASDMLGYRNALALVTGSQREAGVLLQTAIDIATKLKLSITAVTKEYSKFTNSATIAGLSVQKATETFNNFAIAARVLNLSQERTSGMFLALEQMISKGRVSMEELRRQLGEHIPGALNLAAEAMGYGKDELGKFIKEVASGNVVSIDLVQNLGKLVKDRTIKQLPSSLQKFSAAWQDLKNAFTEIGIVIGDFISRMLVPLLTVMAEGVRVVYNWLPATTILGEKIQGLNENLKVTGDTVTSTVSSFRDITDAQTELAATSEDVNTSIQKLKDGTKDLSIASIGLLGVVGTSGLGGAMALLKKGFDALKAGLISFAAPLQKVGGTIAATFGLLSGSKLLNGLTALRAALASTASYIYTLITGFSLIALANPFVAVIAGAVALAGVIWAVRDSANAFNNTLQEAQNEYAKATKEADAFVKANEDLAIRMADLGNADLAVQLQSQAEESKRLKRRNDYLADGLNLLEEQITWWDKLANGYGYTTAHAAELQQKAAELRDAIKSTAGEQDKLTEATKKTREESTAYVEVMSQAKTMLENLVANKDINELKIKIRTIGMSDLERKLQLLRAETAEKLQKAALENKNLQPDAAVAQRIKEEARLTEELYKQEDAFDKAQAKLKEFDQGTNSLINTIDSTVKTLTKQNLKIEENSLAADAYNASMHITELTEQAAALAASATTQAMREKVAVLYENIDALRSLYAENVRLKQEERELGEKEKIEKRARALLEKLGGSQAEYNRQLKEYNYLLKEGVIKQYEFNMLLEDLNKRYAELLPMTEQINLGLADGIKDYGEAVDSTFKQVKSTVQSVAQHMEDALVNFAETGKASMKDMVKSILSDLLRLQAKKAVSNLLGLAVGGIGGALGGGSFLGTLFAANGAVFNSGYTKKFAKGGSFTNNIVDHPTRFRFAKGTGLMGEAGPEAILPLTKMPSGNLGVESTGGNGGGGTQNNVSVQVVVNSDGSASARTQSSGNDARLLGEAVAARVKQSLIEELRPGGLLNRA